VPAEEELLRQQRHYSAFSIQIRSSGRIDRAAWFKLRVSRVRTALGVQPSRFAISESEYPCSFHRRIWRPSASIARSRFMRSFFSDSAPEGLVLKFARGSKNALSVDVPRLRSLRYLSGKRRNADARRLRKCAIAAVRRRLVAIGSVFARRPEPIRSTSLAVFKTVAQDLHHFRQVSPNEKLWRAIRLPHLSLGKTSCSSLRCNRRTFDCSVT
jgi:hypothetical protein